MFSAASPLPAAGAAGADSDSSSIARKLRESQERQNIILQKIAEKERKMERATDTAAAAAADNNISSASLQYYPQINSASAMQQQAQQQLQSAQMQQPQSQLNYSFAPSSSTPQLLPTQLQQHSARTPLSYGDYAPQTSTSTALDFSLADDRFGSNLGEDENTLMRVRQLASQLRHTKSEGARKDIMLANAQQQVSELSRLANEYASARAAWEAREQQHVLRENEYAQTVAELQSTIQHLTSTESSLRAGNLAAHKDKLAMERSATIQLGDLEATVHSLRAELTTSVEAGKNAAYETSLARRELQRVQQAFQAFESTQLQMTQAMEEKYLALKKEHTNLQEQTESLRHSEAIAQSRAAEREEQLEQREAELSIHARTKISQAALIESLNRELADLQAERQSHKLQLDSLPALKASAAELVQIRGELRQTQGAMVGLETNNASISNQIAHMAAENASLKSLQNELEKSLRESRDRLATLTSPSGELETLRSRAQFLEAEVSKLQIHASNLTAQLDARTVGEAGLVANIESFNHFAVTLLNHTHRMLDAGLGGASNAERESIERDIVATQVPACVKDSVRAASSNLRAGVQAALGEIDHLRSQQAGLLSQVESLGADANAAQQVCRDMENQLQTQRVQAKADADSWNREHEAAHQALERIGSELQSQREDNTQLNTQNLALISELEERTVVIRLWAVELENVARSLLTAAATDAGHGDAKDSTSSSASLSAAEFDGGRSSLGAAAPLSVSEHWPSIRAAFTDILYHIQQRSRGALAELADCNRARKQQRQDVCRLSDELAAVTSQLQATNDAAHQAARSAAQALHDSEARRLTETQRLSDECRDRCQTLQLSYEKIVADLQDTTRRNTTEIIDLTRSQHNLLTACRIMYKAFKPMHIRLQELTTQKAVLTTLYQAGLREHQQVRELMVAMTGNVSAPQGVRALTHGKRALFRAGVIAVLAFRRFVLGPRRNHTYGQLIQVRGEQFSLLDNMQLAADSNLPVVDDSSLSASAQSLVHLLAHFEPFTDSSRGQRSLLSSITAVRFAPSLRAQGASPDDPADISVIRRVALAMANRNKLLEREVQMGATDAWTAKEQARVLIADMQATHAQLTKLSADTLENEKQRVAKCEAEFQAQLTQLRRVEEQLVAVTALKNAMITREEYDVVRSSRDDSARTNRDLESQLTSLQHTLASEREKSQLALTLAVEERDSKLNLFSKKLHDMTEENQQLQVYLRRKSTELTQMERSLHESGELHGELQANLEQCMNKNGAMMERIKVLENELQEHRLFSHKMKSASLQSDSIKQQQDATLSHLQSELREKERELSKAQELIRTLTAATRAATNELDSQMHYSKHMARRAAGPLSSATAPPPHHPYSQTSTPAAQAGARAEAASGGSYIFSAAPANLSVPQPLSQQPPPSLHLRHHPNGRLSLDMGRGGDAATQQYRPQLPSAVASPSGLRFDDLPSHHNLASA